MKSWCLCLFGLMTAHLALGMMGEGLMWSPTANEYQPAAKVIAEHGLLPVQLMPKVARRWRFGCLCCCALTPWRSLWQEGLALINGTQFICALTAEAIARADVLSKQADIIAAVTMEAVRATPTPFVEKVHTVRNQVWHTVCVHDCGWMGGRWAWFVSALRLFVLFWFEVASLCLHGSRLSLIHSLVCVSCYVRSQTGQMESATRLRAVLHSVGHPSNIFTHYPHSVQDAYSLRCVPQVHGIVHDTVQFVKRIISRELNAATDNPMVFAEDDEVVSAGNFHGEYPAKAADYLAVGISELASISERRLERLVNHHLSGPRLKPDSTGVST